jgi:hypothetical protein
MPDEKNRHRVNSIFGVEDATLLARSYWAHEHTDKSPFSKEKNKSSEQGQI